MLCPTCKGEKQVWLPTAFGYLRHGKPVYISCPDCMATGIVDDRYPQWKVVGSKLKDDRLVKRETLRQFCKRNSVDSTLRGMQERGFADPLG